MKKTSSPTAGPRSENFPASPILLVDDDALVLESLAVTLVNKGINNLIKIVDGREVLPMLSEREAELVVLDLGMPTLSGEELLGRLSQEQPDLPIIVITGRDDLRSAVECMRNGATDYLVKPIERSLFVSTVEQAIHLRELQRENRNFRHYFFSKGLGSPEKFAKIKTRAAAMHSIFKYVEMTAPSRRPLLILGESGTGKEMLARCAHDLSNRKGKFVAVNISAFDEALVSDTIFGHQKGAFTGADKMRPGLVEQAQGGTLFLDEIGDLPTSSQVKLLRLLQEGEFYPVGSDFPAKADVRFIFATHRDLPALVEKEVFRKDLFYRINTHHFELPPLRERKEDIPTLLEFFLEEAAVAFEKKKPAFPKDLIALLLTYHFPGNVRELQNLVFDAVAQHRGGVLSMASFRQSIGVHRSPAKRKIPSPQKKPEPGADVLTINEEGPFPTFEEAELFLLTQALRRAGRNQVTAAQMLGISRQALQRRLKKLKFPIDAE